jgi:3-oxoacyl-[acyl-carrier protein] reductase
MDEWDWHRVLDVNLTGAFLMTQSVGRLMRLQGSGVIITLITESARDEKSEAAFIASMRGLEALTRQAAREFDPLGIRVYAVRNIAEKIVGDVFALLDVQTEQR